MASYLQSWVESSKDLPAELVRCFKLMQELDQRSLTLQQQVDKAAAEQLEAAKRQASQQGSSSGAADAFRMDEKTEADMAEVMRIGDEKVNLAHQIYDYVDRNICRLDKELKSFDGELQQERSRLGLPEPNSLVEEPRRKRQRYSLLDKNGSLAQEAEGGDLVAAGAMAVVDPNEPTYCYCNRVSFGEMIGCDNPDCAIEWFHFECVGIPLDGRPKGKWFCKDCSALQRAGVIS